VKEKRARIVIAGTSSGVGKTTIAIALMASLSRKGLNVQPFKVGPDYIDPGFHTLVTNNNSRNLDSFFLGEDGVKKVFINASRGSDVSIIEGVMGLFDGKGRDGRSSTAHIAKVLKAPVVLIIDAGKMAQSGAALAFGYKNFDPGLEVKGVILNNVASEGHYNMLKGPIEEDVGLKVLGYLPRQKELRLPERHLGLVPISESYELKGYINKLISLVKEYIDLKELIRLSKVTDYLELKEKRVFRAEKKYNVKLGVAYDEAFNFYYQDNLDLLKKLGAELIFFSPLKDKKVPDVDGIYIGGGFPESFLLDLENNEKMKESILRNIKKGLPTYVECGGLMYLTRKIRDFNHKSFSMVGAIPACTIMTDRLQAMGYVEAVAIKDHLLLKEKQRLRGHEFHYSTLLDIGDIDYAYSLTGGKGKDGRLEGIVINNLLATYVHVHFGSNPLIAERFLRKCETCKLSNCGDAYD